MKTKFNGILTLLLAFTVHFAFAQKTVSGTVSDESGSLPGVSVLIKGTTTGTETDFDGNYTLQANAGDVLQFSYIGMETAFKKVGTASVYNVVMNVDASNILDEVVVTGVAGATSRKKLSVTVNKISSKDLENVPTASAASILQGKVAGVTVTNFGQPGEGATIQLRGATNLFGSQEPLVIVDGVIVEDGLQDINSDDIKSFEIVKGASASALYGSKAGNGVIVITTKTGRIGKVDVTLKSEMGFTQLTNFMATNTSHEYNLASDWEDYEGDYTRYAGVTYPADYNGVHYGEVTGGRTLSADHYSDNPFGVSYDPQEQFFRTGINTNLYASIATASEKSSIFFSADKTDSEGILKDTKGYARRSVRLNADYQINDWLKFSARNNFIRVDNNTPGGTNGIFFNLSLTSPDVNLDAVNLDGQPHLLYPSQWSSTTQNPLYSLAKNPEKELTNKFLGGYKFNVKFTDWLNFDTEYTIETSDRSFTDFNSSTTLVSGGSKEELFSTYSPGNYYVSDRRSTSQKAQFTLNFKESFGELGLTSKLSYLLEDTDYSFSDVYAFNEVFAGRTISLDNYEDQLVSSNKTSINAKNVFGIIGLDYKDRYLFDAMYRKDGSSAFGENEKWNDYFRVSGAYRISKDIDIKGVDELKIHAAYGTAGQRPGFGWTTLFREVGSDGILTGVYIGPNADLKPSKTTELEFGLNSRLFNRINLEAVYSEAETEDQFMLRDKPTFLYPYNKRWENVGTVAFNTIEVAMDADILKDSQLTWNTGVVFEKTKSEITELNAAPVIVGVGGVNTPGMIFRLEEGLAVGTMYGYNFVTTLDEMEAQLPTGDSIDDYAINRDGVVVKRTDIGTVNEAAILLLNEDGSNNYGEIGSAAPDFKLGFRNTFKFKNFNFYTLLDWKKGGDVYNRQAQWLTRDNRHAMLDQSDYEDSEKKTTDYYQSLYHVNDDLGFWVEDASYVKLREASLFYTFTKEKLNGGLANGLFESIRIGVTGTNLLTFTNYSGWDPEVQLYDSETRQYYPVDYNVYPTNTTYKLSFMLKF